jgi:outer membrane protein
MRLMAHTVVMAACLAGVAAADAPALRPGAKDLLQDGRLRLTVADAVHLSLESGAVRMNRVAYESAQYGVDRAASRFDPRVSSVVTANDSTQRSTVTTEGALRRIDTGQAASVGLSQRLPVGTQASISVGGGRSSTNNAFANVNPEFNSSFRITATQSLWRNQLGFQDRAEVRVARYEVARSRASLAAELQGAVQSAVSRYWNAVLASEGLAVRRKSLELAEATHAKNRRMLELGALPPLEIHRSEADVASRRLDVLRGEFELRRSHDELKRELGIDADPELARADIELVDTPEAAATDAVDADAAVAAALRARPEIAALERASETDEAQVGLARDRSRPGLDLTASYALSGVSGTELDLSASPATVLSQGGLSRAFDQLGRRQFPVYTIGVTLDLPLHNRANRAALATARLEQERGRLELQEKRLDVGLEVRRAVDEVQHTQRAIELAVQARDLSKKTLESEQRKYELGAAELFLVLQEQARFAQSELALLSAKVDYQEALTRLDLATGRLLDRYQVSID